MPFKCFTVYFFCVTDLTHELLYLENLPSAESYERSYMHRDVITHIVVTKYVDQYLVHESILCIVQNVGIPTSFWDASSL
jgi:hypothetical protein